MYNNLKKDLIIICSVVVFIILGFYINSWSKTCGKKKIKDGGFDIYVDESVGK
jgi:hypothetical protein